MEQRANEEDPVPQQEHKTPDIEQEPSGVVAAEIDPHGATVVAAVADESGVQAVGIIDTDYFNTVVAAEFANPDAAQAAYLALRDAELAGHIRVDGVLAVRSDGEGKIHVVQMTDHSTKTGIKWGAAGGLALAVLFPPSILASTIVWGSIGGVLGKLRNAHHRSEVAQQLDGAIGPNHSGIIALVHAGDVPLAMQTMPGASKVTTAEVDETTAKDITEAAKQAS